MQAQAQDLDGIVQQITLPEGFKIEVFAELPKPRSLTVCGPNGTVFVGSRQGAVYSLHDTDRDGPAGNVAQRASGLNVPNGVACRDDRLYIALKDRIVLWPGPADSDADARLSPLADVLTGLPRKSHHGSRYAKFGPHGRLHVAIGSPCNICEPKGLEGTIIRMDEDGGNVETVATGIRNSVGFDWHPETGALFFTDNGADGMGEDIPPDELNKIDEIGGFYGFPYLGGKDIALTGFEDKTPPETPIAPVIAFGAHTANLGMHFYDGNQFPAEYKGDAFVAQHGSWNRTVPDGYRIMRITFDDEGNPTGAEPFATGWLEDGSAIGRPVDIAELPDGSLIVSDDFANVIYRISYGK